MPDVNCLERNGHASATQPLNGQCYRERLPRSDAARLLSCVWIQEVSRTARCFEHRTVPNGCVEIACALSSGLVRAVGSRRKPTVERLAPGETVVGLRFRPGAALAVLGLPAAELIDREVDLDRLRGPAAVALGERVAEAASPEHAVRQLEEIVTRLAGDSEPDPLVAEAVERLQPWEHAPSAA
jgi:Domain of unknown function (DUF6597)